MLACLLFVFSRPEEANDVISGKFGRLIVPDNDVKLGDPRLNRSREIRGAHFVMDDDRRRHRRKQVITKRHRPTSVLPHDLKLRENSPRTISGRLQEILMCPMEMHELAADI